MNVTELNSNELYQLKQELYYMEEILPNLTAERLAAIKDADIPDNIPDQIVYEVYNGVNFVKDDFWCNVE